MRKCLMMLSAVVGTLLLGGCFTPSANTVYEYDKDGLLVKKTESTTSLAETVIGGLKDHSILLFDNSFLAYMSASTATTENPTPTVKFGLGKNDKSYVILHKAHDIAKLSDVIQTARAGEVTITPAGASVNKQTENTEK